MKTITPRIWLTIFILPLAIVIAAVPENKTKTFKITVDEMLREFNEGEQYISTDAVADMIVQKDPSLMLIDVRPEDEYNEFHLEGAINIPLYDILNENWQEYLDQDIRTNVFYCNGTVKANEAWMICRQLGYTNNNLVMQGGLNYWAETIMNPSNPTQLAPGDEYARYNFRKAANTALGGAQVNDSSSAAPSNTKTAAPKLQIKTKKKRVAGGCS